MDHGRGCLTMTWKGKHQPFFVLFFYKVNNLAPFGIT